MIRTTQLGVALNRIGQAHYFRSLNSGDQDWDTPQAYFQQALDHSQAAGDTRGASESLFQLGLMHERKGQHDTASAYYQQVIELADQHDYKREKSYATRHLAGIFHGRGELDQALAHFERARALAQALGFQRGLAAAEAEIAELTKRDDT
jgi:tetratricopeptide (TPR) repeat protein